MFEYISGWWIFGGVVVLSISLVFFWMLKTQQELEIYRLDVREVLNRTNPEAYDEEIVDWHFYEYHDGTKAVAECIEQWELGQG